MALIDKLGRLASLASIVGLSLGSMVVAACGGKTSTDGHTEAPDDVQDVQEEDATTDEPQDVAEEDPDTDLWDVIAE